jgi:hypothetical protein
MAGGAANNAATPTATGIHAFTAPFYTLVRSVRISRT